MIVMIFGRLKRMVLWPLVLLLGIASILAFKRPLPLYKLDPSWPGDPTVFTNQIFSAAVNSSNGHVFVGQRNANTSYIYEFDPYGNYLGSILKNRTILNLIHGMGMQKNPDTDVETLWCTDVGNGSFGHTVKQFSGSGNLLKLIGSPGKAGTALKPVQFGNVADVAFDEQSYMYVVDGDGGVNNRLLKLDSASGSFNVMWSVGENGTKPGQFKVPHSVGVNGKYVWVADRMNNRLQVFTTNNGSLVSACVMEGGEPYSIRFSPDKSHIVVAQLQSNSIAMVSSDLPTGFTSTCKTIDTIQLGDDIKPHLVAVDPNSGAVYVAEIGGNACQKFLPIKQNFKSVQGKY